MFKNDLHSIIGKKRVNNKRSFAAPILPSISAYIYEIACVGFVILIKHQL